MKFIPFLAFTTLFMMSTPSQSAEPSTAQIQFGKHWAGPELKTAESLKGKVVLLKIWGR